MKRKVLYSSLIMFTIGLLLLLPLTAAGTKEQAQTPQFEEEDFWTVEGYDYDKLVAAAQAEGSLVARWQSGRARRLQRSLRQNMASKQWQVPPI